MPEATTAPSLAEAKVGDCVWLFDANRGKYVNGKYAGRGVWMLEPIVAETRQSFELAGEKFDRKTGFARTKNNYNTGNEIAGQLEYDCRAYSDARHRIASAVSVCRDAAKLRQIAEIVGWRPEV